MTYSLSEFTDPEDSSVRVARMERTRARLREATGVVLSDEDVAAGVRLLRDIAEGRRVEIR